MYATAIPAGTLTIRAAADSTMSCELWLNDDFVGSFPSADAAAQSVSHHASGCALIDAARAKVPDSIDAWQWISVSSLSANQPVFLMRGAQPSL
ncbi:hypothetical protein [Steroidobacter sp.]|uniref:hypothetical protein n=1 Tax=Steroidobacter sp. TaxID=1978227 RepID=UPI001A5CE745|nr:hypothetical protein [Steroidobacter sp.]MBL8268576.1 hypothetical protein [Steroidobacter sp.]